jgi:hypothetical protein
MTEPEGKRAVKMATHASLAAYLKFQQTPEVRQ